MAARFLPESAEIRLELTVAADMVVRIVALVRYGINMLKFQSSCNGLRHIEDEILRAIGMTRLRHLLDDILGIFHIRSLHRTDPHRHLAIRRFIQPEDDLIKRTLTKSQHDGKKPLLALSRLEKKKRSEFFLHACRTMPERHGFMPIKI